MYWTLELASKLEDAPWPATRDELLDWALRTGAQDEIIENLQEIEDEGEIYERIEDLWPDYPSKDDFFFNEDEYWKLGFVITKRLLGFPEGLFSFLFVLVSFEGEKLVAQIAERHADDWDDDVGDGRPPLEHFDEEFQAKIVDEDIANGDEEIPDNLRPATQSGAWETDVARHPEACQEGDGKLEDEGRNMGCEGYKAEVEDFGAENEMVKNVVQYPLQGQIESTASRVTKQLWAYELAERRVEEVNDRGQGAFHPGFYVAESWHEVAKIGIYSQITSKPASKSVVFWMLSVKPNT